MKYLTIIALIFTVLPAFSACPIDGEACIAEFQPTITQPINKTMQNNVTSKSFVPTPSATNLKREVTPQKGLRMFGPTKEDYGYNASCQFGVCQNTGTPKNFSPNNE